MQVYVNNKAVETEACTLAGLVEQLRLPARGVAVAVGRKMVRQADWQDHELSAGDAITVIKAACGG